MSLGGKRRPFEIIFMASGLRASEKKRKGRHHPLLLDQEKKRSRKGRKETKSRR